MTFDPRRNSRAGVTSRSGLAARFDRMLIRGAWRPTAMQVVPTHGVSDHEAIVAEFQAPRTEKPVHSSAAVVIPPQFRSIQAIREQFDCHIKNWMPHFTLLYGFLPEAAFEDAVRALRARLSRIVPFDITLSDYGTFQHKSECTAWLRPSPAEPLRALEAALVEVFPQCIEQRGHGQFVPHLTIGRFRSASAAEERLPRWEPQTFRVSEIALISRRGDEPFEVRHRVPLGTPLDRLPRLSVEGRRVREAAIATIRQAWPHIDVIGSHRLGIDTDDSDLDVVGSGTIDAAAFFDHMQRTLGGTMAEARVPVLRIDLGCRIELQYGTAAVAETEALLASVQHLELMRAVNTWAHRRGIHGQSQGFLGTFSWNVLAAWACRQEVPGDTLGDAFTHMMRSCAEHGLRTPIGLSSHPFQPEERDRMPILTSIEPVTNSAFNVIRSTARIIRNEIERAAHLAMRGDWDGVFEQAVPEGPVLVLESPPGGWVSVLLRLERSVDIRPWPGVPLRVGVPVGQVAAALEVVPGARVESRAR